MRIGKPIKKSRAWKKAGGKGNKQKPKHISTETVVGQVSPDLIGSFFAPKLKALASESLQRYAEEMLHYDDAMKLEHQLQQQNQTAQAEIGVQIDGSILTEDKQILSPPKQPLFHSQARVDELSAALRVASLPARVDERSALSAAASAADQVVRQTLWRSGQKSLAAPQAGLIAEVFFRPGEYVAAGQPVLSLLPPENIKLRFFVPESELGSIATGQAVQISCDACATPIAAHITRIASQAEYTPPVIYSNAQRAKLVFMVEARPDQATAPQLHPGQPVEVKAMQAAKSASATATEKKS